MEVVERVSSYVGAIQIGQSKQQEKLEFITAFLNRQSSWCRAVRVFAWMRRLSLLLRCPKESTERKVLTNEEISGASSAIIAIVQQAMFFEEIVAIKALNPIRSSSPLLTVSPFFRLGRYFAGWWPAWEVDVVVQRQTSNYPAS